MKKRITALLLVMTLVFGIAGCGGNETAKDELTSDGKLKLSVFMWDLDTRGSGDDPIYDKLSEKFKVEFEPVTATYAQWREKLNLLFASGDIPDFFICAGTEDALQDIIHPGIQRSRFSLALKVPPCVPGYTFIIPSPPTYSYYMAQ